MGAGGSKIGRAVANSPFRVVEGGLDRKSDISVVGLGYVGAVSVACLAQLGFNMVGVDISTEKVESINAGQSPIVEDRLEDLLTEGVAAGRISATTNLITAVLDTNVTFLSVGTPTAADGSCDLTYVREASRAIGQAIAMKDDFHLVVLRCSVPPGTTLDVVGPEIAMASGKEVGEGFGLCFNPEFLREGVAIADFFAPPKTVVGASDDKSRQMATAIYREIDENVLIVSIEAAEMVKYADNVWHATKVAFANEVGRICKSLRIDSHEVMDVFVQDTKLNLSPYYLKPGFAFGGSCLPKEVRAVGHLADEQGIDVPLLNSLMASNAQQIDQAVTLLEPYRGKRIGILGLTFKPGTDDVRESPILELMARLRGQGEDVLAYDPNIQFGSSLQGQLAYVKHATASQADLMDELEALCLPSGEELMHFADVVVVAHATKEFRRLVSERDPGVHIIDLARIYPAAKELPTYQGIAW
ncbi:MAG: nucleotide sugar dehydrogenase [Hyphomicrobiaceae bacterium]